MINFAMLFLQMFTWLQTPELYANYSNGSSTYISFIPNILAKIPFNTVAVIFAIATLAIFVLLAIFRKKCRALACIAGVFNSLGILLTPWLIRLFHTLPVRQAINLIFDMSSEDIVPALLLCLAMIIKAIIVSVISSITMIGLVLSIVYVATCFKNKPAIFAIFALIINIIKYMFIAPCPVVLPLLLKLILPFPWVVCVLIYLIQLFQLILVGCFVVLPPLLVLIPVMVNFIKEKKSKKLEASNSEEAQEAKEDTEKSVEEKAEEKPLGEKAELMTEEKDAEQKTEEKPAEEKSQEQLAEKTEDKAEKAEDVSKKPE